MSALPWGVYVHVPWCRVRCPYCAFDIVPRERPDDQAFLDGVLADLDRWWPAFDGAPATLYFGGGTPSLLAPTTLGRLVERIGAAHVSLEANPEDVTDAWLSGVIEAGVQRISLGVQSFQTGSLRLLGRAHHDPGPALARLAAAPLQSWSADLIFGLPDQTLAALDADLDALLAFEPPHVSLYDLTLEPGTGLTRLHERRPLPLPDEDTWATLQDRIVERLQDAGLERYEVSNFARPGHRSLHNQLYWQLRPYLGAGPGAHGLAPDGRRWVNASWSAWRIGTPPTVDTPTPHQAALDALVAGLRGTGGLEPDRLAPFIVDPAVRTRLVAQGLLRDTGALALTPRGLDVIDAVTRALADALVPVADAR